MLLWHNYFSMEQKLNSLLEHPESQPVGNRKMVTGGGNESVTRLVKWDWKETELGGAAACWGGLNHNRWFSQKQNKTKHNRRPGGIAFNYILVTDSGYYKFSPYYGFFLKTISRNFCCLLLSAFYIWGDWIISSLVHGHIIKNWAAMKTQKEWLQNELSHQAHRF